MASHAHLIFLSHRNDPFEKVSDALPVLLGVNWPSLGKRGLLFGFFINESTIMSTPSAGTWLSAHYTENAQVVFQGRNASPGSVTNHLADVIDFSVPFRTLS